MYIIIEGIVLCRGKRITLSFHHSSLLEKVQDRTSSHSSIYRALGIIDLPVRYSVLICIVGSQHVSSTSHLRNQSMPKSIEEAVIKIPQIHHRVVIQHV